ncbi:MAG: APC family permease [Eubacteriales bacterium]|jgi:APA family basic amino acid/polyamine antiporter|nr:APC family permease [Eubacteriales bacterium]
MSNEKGKLGLLSSTTILIGGMIGSAIFSLSGLTIMNAGPASIISWIVAGIILIAYGLQTAELSTMYPQSGGIFVFPSKALGKTEKAGKIWGWISAWAYLFGCIAGAAFSAMYVGIYLSVSFPALGSIGTVIAIGVVILCGILNIIQISAMGKINSVLTIGLSVAMVVFIATGLTSGKWDGSALTPFFTQGLEGTFGFMGAIPIAMVAFGAIVAVSFMVGEIKNPKKTVPQSMIIAMSVVLVLYVLMIVTTLGLVSAGFLQQNPGMAYIPMYAAVFTTLANLPWLGYVVTIAAVLALMTTILVVMALAGRALQASAQAGILPKGLSKINAKTNTPVNAQLVVILVVGIIAAFPSATNFIVNFGSLCNAIVVAIICLTIIAARKKNPEITVKFTAPGGSVLPIATFIAIIVAYIPGIIAGGYMLWVWTAVYFVIGMAIYFISQAKKKA